MQASPDRIGPAARALVSDAAHERMLSAASAWEIVIKQRLGRLTLPEPPERYVPERMRTSAVDGLPITHRHALAVGALPLLHRDPFDRMLVAQARVERVTIVTADPLVLQYDVDVLDAR